MAKSILQFVHYSMEGHQNDDVVESQSEDICHVEFQILGERMA